VDIGIQQIPIEPGKLLTEIVISGRQKTKHRFSEFQTMSIRIAVLDDEPDILHLVELNLKKASFLVDCHQDPHGFFGSLRNHRPDLIILDLMLPGTDGFDICRQLKNDPGSRSIPIIMLTARVRESDKVTGLDLGADDYITKPFSPRELVARVKAVLRRSGHESEKTITVGGILVIDFEKFEVQAGDATVQLTPSEFKILRLLASNIGKVFSREKILDRLWGNDKAVFDRTVDVHIKNLRDKLGSAGRLIVNVRGAGYAMKV